MQIRCPHCNQVLNAPDDADVAQGKCPHCGEMVNLAKAERVGIGPGDALGDFRVDRLVGRGGMAAVYRGTQLSLDRPVAIKVLASQLAKRPHFVERFHREARVLAQLSHHNIVSVLAVGEHEDTYYLVMEYVEGESLRSRLTRDGNVPFAEAVGLIDGVAAGLEYAHNHDVLHRDIKPGNILITEEGVPKIVDFGIARLTGADEAAQQRLTMAQTRMGSAHYMAPEQMSDAAAADHRADIYALGVMLYEMLTGKLPIGHFTPASKTPGVPMAVDRILRQCLTAKPDDRIQTAAQFRALVQRLSLIGQPTRIQEGGHAHSRDARSPGHVGGVAVPRRAGARKNPLPMVLGGVGLLVVAIVAFLALRGGEPEPQVKQPPPKDKKVVTPDKPTPPEKPKGPTEAEKREAAAKRLYADAAHSLESGDAATAKRLLAQLDQMYGQTAWYRANLAAVSKLSAAVEAKLAPPKKPETKDPEVVTRPKPKETVGVETPAKPPDDNVADPPATAKGPRFFHGAVRALPDGRVEFRYDWSDPEQLRDWKKKEGRTATVAGGTMTLEGARVSGIDHTVPFVGDVTVAAAWVVTRRSAGVGRCHGVHLNGTVQFWPGGVVLLNNRSKVGYQKAPFPVQKAYTCQYERTKDAMTVWLNGKPCVAASAPATYPITAGLGVTGTTVAYEDVRIVGTPDPAWLAANPDAKAHLDALRGKPEPAPAESPYRKAVAELRPLWQKRAYADALAKARTLGNAGLIEDAEALAGLWQAVRAGAAKLKPGDPFRIRGMAGKVTKVEADTIHARAGPVELGMKLTQLDDAAFVGLARKGRALTSAQDLLALALLEIHAEKPSPAAIRAALARAAKAGVDRTRHQALLTGKTEAPAAAAAWGEPFGAVAQKVDQANPGTGHFSQVWRILTEYPAGSQYRVRVQHAASGDKGAFRIWAWADATGDGVPDAKIGTSKVLRAKRAGDWSTWEFQTHHTRVFVGNWFVPGTLIYYQGGKNLHTGLGSTVYYSRSVGGVPTSKSPGPRCTNIQVQVKRPAAPRSSPAGEPKS